MGDEQFFAAIIIALADRLEDLFVVRPHLLEITVIGIAVEFDGVISVSVCFEDVYYERIVESLEGSQVKSAVFFVGDTYRLVIEFGLRLA